MMYHPRNVIARVAVAAGRRRRHHRHAAAAGTGLPPSSGRVVAPPASSAAAAASLSPPFSTHRHQHRFLRNADPDRHHRAVVARAKATLSSHAAAFDDDATPSSSSANRSRVEDGEHGSGVGIGGVGGPTETTTTTTTRGAMDFADPASAHGSKTTTELLRAIVVLRLCRLPFLVRHSDLLLKLSTKVLGRDTTDGLLRRTFFGHFCAGEDGDDARRVVERLGRDNVGPILDYAAEGDPPPPPPTAALFNQPARVYSYASEVECDRHASIFASCIRSARDISPIPGRGFAAIKITALGDPALLERMSSAIVEIRNLFGKFDVSGTGSIGRDEFERCYERYFHVDDGRLTDILELLRVDTPSSGGGGDSMIDYISFSQLFTPYTLPSFTSRCRDVGPLALATPTDEEVALLGRTSERLHGLAEEAARCGTRLLIDAEHTKYQPAIDNLVLELQRKYNAADRPVVFNTYQCYLKDAKERVTTDLKRADRFDFHFAAKLVRGAYMVHERERARTMNYQDPIHETAERTHRCYDEVVELLLRYRSRRGPGLEIMIATHNEASIGRAADLMSELGIAPSDECASFAQLYGMSDNLTFTLGRHGYNAFKYLPYGKVREAVPYLVRRAQENGDVLGNTGTELRLLHEELRRRYSFA